MPQQLEDKQNQHQPIIVSGGYNVGGIKSDAKPDGDRQWRVFVIKYVSVTVILGVLSIGVKEQTGWNGSVTLIFFSALSIFMFIVLSLIDSKQLFPLMATFFNYMLERRLSKRLEELERLRLEATDSWMMAKSREEEKTKRLAIMEGIIGKQAYVDGKASEMERIDILRQTSEFAGFSSVVIEDEVKDAMVRFTFSLFDVDQNGKRMYVNKQGRIVNKEVPWSKRGGFDRYQQRRAEELLRQVNLYHPMFKQAKNAWFFNIRHYDDQTKVAEAFKHVG